MELFLTPLIDFKNNLDRTKILRTDSLDDHRTLINNSQLKRILSAAGCGKKVLADKSYRSHLVSATVSFSNQDFRDKYTRWIFSRYSESAEEDRQLWRNESDVLVNWARHFNSSHSNLKIIGIHSLVNSSMFESRIKLIGFTVRNSKVAASRFSFNFTKALRANFRNQSITQAYYLFEIYEGHNLAEVMQRLFNTIIPEAQLRFISVKPSYKTVLKLLPHKKNSKKQAPKQQSSTRHSNQDLHQSNQSISSATSSKSAITTSASSYSVNKSSSQSTSQTVKPRSIAPSHNSFNSKFSHHSADYPVKRSTKSASNLSNDNSLSNNSVKSHVHQSSRSVLVQVASGPFKLVKISSVSSTSNRSNGHRGSDQRRFAGSGQAASNINHKRSARPARSLVDNHSDARAESLFKSRIKSLSANIKEDQNKLNRLPAQAKKHRKEFRKAMRGSANGFKSNQRIRIVSSGLTLLNSHVQVLSKALHDNLDVIAQLSGQYTNQINNSHHKSQENKKSKKHKSHHKWLHKFKL